MKNIFLSIFLASTASLATAAGWTNGLQVVGETIWRPGYHGFYAVGGTFHDPEGCVQPGAGSSLYLFDPAFEAAEPKLTDRLFAMILLAQTTKKKVYVYVDGCVSGYPKITGMQLQA